MKIQTRHFGEIEIDENKVITFTEGLPGFEHLRGFVFIESEDNVFGYLQSIEDDEIAFTIIDPYTLKVDYKPQIHENYFEKLGGGSNEDFSLYVIATVGKSLDQTTVNLQGPLLLHIDNKLGVQAIVENNEYKSRHQVVELIKERG